MKECAKLKNLYGPGKKTFKDTIDALAKILKNSNEDATVHFRFISKKNNESWYMTLGRKTTHVGNKHTKPADMEIVTRQGTWQKIASGRLSPLSAILEGNFRIRGDIHLGSRLLEKASDRGTLFSKCFEDV